MRFLIVAIFLLICACKSETPAVSPAQTPTPVEVKPSPTPAASPTPAIIKMEKLAWESASYPERVKWSTYTFQVVEKVFDTLDQAQDMSSFCPKYSTLNKMQKVNVWGQLIAGMAYYESGWKPTSRMQESTFDYLDKVTGKSVYSEGLLQLSYGDIQWAPYCKFDWSKDKLLSATSPQKTILDPFINLDCGIRILADQVKRKKLIAMKSGVYWAVLKEEGKYTQIPNIKKVVQKISFCN